MQYKSPISSTWLCAASLRIRARRILPGSFSKDPLHFASHVYLSQAAIDEHLDAGCIATVVGGQEQDGLRDFICGAGTAQGEY